MQITVSPADRSLRSAGKSAKANKKPISSKIQRGKREFMLNFASLISN